MGIGDPWRETFDFLHRNEVTAMRMEPKRYSSAGMPNGRLFLPVIPLRCSLKDLRSNQLHAFPRFASLKGHIGNLGDHIHA